MSLKAKILVVCCLIATVALAADKLTVGQLSKDPSKYDGKSITVSGLVDKFEQRTSRAGNPYVTAILVDKVEKKAKLNLYVRGKMEKELKKGDAVEVTGTYAVEKKVGNLTFKNEVEAKLDQVKVTAPAK